MYLVNRSRTNNRRCAYHRNIPTLSTCAVAKKSLVGENETLVATLLVRNASISLPVGTSNVRMIESNEVVINHRESGEKVYNHQFSVAGHMVFITLSRIFGEKGAGGIKRGKRTNNVQNPCTEAGELSN